MRTPTDDWLGAPRQTASLTSARMRLRTSSADAKRRIAEAVEVELERLALDDVRRFARHRDVRDGHLGLATRREPAQLEGRPQVGAEKRHCAVQAKLRPAWAAREMGNSSDAS